VINPRTERHNATGFAGAALLAGALVITAASAISAQQVAVPRVNSQTPHATPSTAKQTVDEMDGERVFALNCSRCHNAPDGFSPHVAGTVVRHMRVRASLSVQDEKTLLRFFNAQ
jgi:cytochrome c5